MRAALEGALRRRPVYERRASPRRSTGPGPPTHLADGDSRALSPGPCPGDRRKNGRRLPGPAPFSVAGPTLAAADAKRSSRGAVVGAAAGPLFPPPRGGDSSCPILNKANL